MSIVLPWDDHQLSRWCFTTQHGSMHEDLFAAMSLKNNIILSQRQVLHKPPQTSTSYRKPPFRQATASATPISFLPVRFGSCAVRRAFLSRTGAFRLGESNFVVAHRSMALDVKSEIPAPKQMWQSKLRLLARANRPDFDLHKLFLPSSESWLCWNRVLLALAIGGLGRLTDVSFQSLGD